MLREIPGRRELVNRLSLDIVSGVLECGKALFDGRCNTFVLFYPPASGVKIYYVSFCSLYSYSFSIGSPRRIVSPVHLPTIEDLINGLDEDYSGLIHVEILPPRELYIYIPALPHTIDGKLTFTLFSTCAQQNENLCTHSDKPRVLKGVYTSPELKLASQKGYKIIKIKEI